MSGVEDREPAQLHVLDESDCWELLGTKNVGRVAVSDPEGPDVVPVNYVVNDRMVLFRTSPYTRLADRLRDGVASFQVDSFDEGLQTGWSVLVRGHAEHAEPWELPGASDRPTPWAAGSRNLHIRLSPHKVTGRRLLRR